MLLKKTTRNGILSTVLSMFACEQRSFLMWASVPCEAKNSTVLFLQ